ncbi:DUF2812 domain-containing protein [Sedimentibacter sp.]|uniref:DUF2812 domain-containing protein n=1 Tax=Sedimentibacter sp. TaxID=1960295 RepID=UPI0028AA1E18|nr:DUF2812 domain-containing protein [Sedimentibacter sp.]
MKNKTKRVFWGFFSLDYKAMAEYLEEMAEKGWMLEKVGRITAKFRAIEPRKLKFYVDVFKEGGPLTPEETEESEEYRKLCQESGWTFITSQDYLQFFYADGDSEPVPIQTDEEIEQKIVELTLWKSELLGIFILSLIAVWVFFRLFPISDTNLISFTGFTGTFLFPVLYTFSAIPAVYSIIRIIKARKNIKRGLPIEKPTLKSARRRIMAFHVPVRLIALFYVLSIIGDAFFRPDIVSMALLGPGVGLTIGFGLRYIIKKKSIKKENSVLYVIIAMIIAVVFINIVGPFVLEKNEEIYITDSIPKGYPAVSIEEILNTQHGSSIQREFKPGMSPVTPKYYEYFEKSEVNGSVKRMRIKYYKTIAPYFAEIIFNGITNDIEKGFKWHGMTIFNRTIITDDELKSLWDADNLALTEERDEITIQKGNTVLHLSGDIDFNDRQTRELMIERFFSDVQLKN